MLKTIGIVALVMLLLLLAIPLGIGMVMGPCPECPTLAAAPMAACLAILVGLMLLAFFGTSALVSFKTRRRMLLLARRLERPPRFA